jgi:hypothetical protein
VAYIPRLDTGLGASGHLDRRVRSLHSDPIIEPNSSILVGGLFKRVGQLWITLLAISIENTP